MLALQPTGDERPSPAGIEGVTRVGPGARYRLLIASVGGPWNALGELTLGDRTDDDDAEAIRFNPWNTADDLCPVGPLMGLRLPAYEGSQEGSAG